MSENEDFFLDQDFLNDLDETSQLYYSQIDDTKHTISQNKRRKLNHATIENREVVSKFIGKKAVDKALELSSRKNLILDIIENNSPSTTTTTSIAINQSVSTATTNPTTSNSFIKKYPSHDGKTKRPIEKSTALSSTKKLALKIMEEKSSKPEQIRIESPSKNARLLGTISPLETIKMTNNTQETLNIKSSIDKYSQDLFKTPLVNQPKTLVRKFPGPAGLIPDGMKDTLKEVLKDTLKDNLVDDAIYYLQNLDEHEMSVSQPSDISRISEFCSQETKKLFSDGAWRRMLDDLPKNFLRGHDIASLKRPGRPNKVPLLAAVIHRIQHNAENPRIILKDISNSIEAIMHKDIPTKYPNILQPGVVILLRDIGVLNFQGAQKYSTISLVMIPPNSVLGVYSNKERLVTTPALNEILRRDYDVEPTDTINNTQKYNGTAALKVANENISRPKRDKYKLRIGGKLNRQIVQRNIKNENPIENFDDISDIDFDEPFVAFQRNDSENLTTTNEDHAKTIVTKAIVEVQPNNSLISCNSSCLTVSPITDNDPTDIINTSEDTTVTQTTGFADDLFNDTDDEILSQFDVDSMRQ